MLDRFAPEGIVHDADRILAATLGLLLLSNAARMFRAMTRGKGIPFSAYLAASAIDSGRGRRRSAAGGNARRKTRSGTGSGTCYW